MDVPHAARALHDLLDCVRFGYGSFGRILKGLPLKELVERAEREPAALADELAAFSVQTIMQPLTPLPECRKIRWMW
jgi:hypothetical protein